MEVDNGVKIKPENTTLKYVLKAGHIISIGTTITTTTTSPMKGGSPMVQGSSHEVN